MPEDLMSFCNFYNITLSIIMMFLKCYMLLKYKFNCCIVWPKKSQFRDVLKPSLETRRLYLICKKNVILVNFKLDFIILT